jgi:hypothetical protein
MKEDKIYIAYNFGGCYTQITERSPMDGGDDAVRVFPLLAYSIPLQPRWSTPQTKAKIITALSLPTFERAEWLDDRRGIQGSALEG